MKIEETRLSRCGVVLVVVVVLAALGCCVPAIGAEAPSVTIIAAALQQQQNAPIDVAFTMSERPAGATETDEVKDYIETHYVRTSDVLWAKTKLNISNKEIQESSYDRTTKEYRCLTTWPDGRVQARIRHNALVGALQEQSLLDPERFYLSGNPTNSTAYLYEWVNSAKVSPKMEAVDGHSCWKLVIDDPAPYAEKFEIWVDPTIGFCPRQVDIVRKVIGRCRTQFDDYTEVAPNIWLPKLQVCEVPKTSTGEAVTITLRAKEIKSGVKPDKATLLVKIPSGTRLYIDNATEAIDAP